MGTSTSQGAGGAPVATPPPVRDIVSQLPADPSSPWRRYRQLDQIDWIAIHWTGTARPEGDYDEVAYISGLARYHMSKDWSSDHSGVHGFGLMYHRVIAASGTIYLTQPLELITWNAHSPANERDLAILVDCGAYEGGLRQQPTPAQLVSLKWYLDQLTMHTPQIPAIRSGVYGHCELPNNPGEECPGTLLPYAQGYRTSTW